jgi:hypothetical protein
MLKEMLQKVRIAFKGRGACGGNQKFGLDSIFVINCRGKVCKGDRSFVEMIILKWTVVN